MNDTSMGIDRSSPPDRFDSCGLGSTRLLSTNRGPTVNNAMSARCHKQVKMDGQPPAKGAWTAGLPFPRRTHSPPAVTVGQRRFGGRTASSCSEEKFEVNLPSFPNIDLFPPAGHQCPERVARRTPSARTTVAMPSWGLLIMGLLRPVLAAEVGAGTCCSMTIPSPLKDRPIFWCAS